MTTKSDLGANKQGNFDNIISDHIISDHIISDYIISDHIISDHIKRLPLYYWRGFCLVEFSNFIATIFFSQLPKWSHELLLLLFQVTLEVCQPPLDNTSTRKSAILSAAKRSRFVSIKKISFRGLRLKIASLFTVTVRL